MLLLLLCAKSLPPPLGVHRVPPFQIDQAHHLRLQRWHLIVTFIATVIMLFKEYLIITFSASLKIFLRRSAFVPSAMYSQYPSWDLDRVNDKEVKISRWLVETWVLPKEICRAQPAVRQQKEKTRYLGWWHRIVILWLMATSPEQFEPIGASTRSWSLQFPCDSHFFLSFCETYFGPIFLGDTCSHRHFGCLPHSDEF